ncbi:MAG: hypothetical protein A2428_00545 [Bdellovibrionales bacterium RIFOXYC1_FULL_54_43]|nr:MAG: hypothetical protein A2428_00545 [Bdellovibrionales bacterium RIFOXYC1_FULL_54_43]OFZ82477.1 MAG: hypothetical protein A2603_15520 [Bdellovibrionales bacterium RIFOXYD1_FULL_55_31]
MSVMRNACSLIPILVILSLAAAPFANSPAETVWAAPPEKKKFSFEEEESKIPIKPTAPAPIPGSTASDLFHCERYFIFEGKKLNCDSMVRQDGEELRPIIEDVPEAIAELNIYQRNQRNLRTAAYVGSTGLVIAAIGMFIKQRYSDSSKDLATSDPATAQSYSSKADLLQALVYTGLGLTAGTVIYGISLLRTNETHLGNAVRHYNSANPAHPIELQFTTEIAF